MKLDMLIIKSRRTVKGGSYSYSVIPPSSSPLLLLLFLFFSPCSLLLLVSSFSSVSSSSAPRCTVNDVGRTPGECTHIRKCKYQIGRLRVGATVTNCPGGGGGRGDVCCPKGMSISEMRCLQWRDMLYAPVSFDQPRFTTPMCGIGGPFRQFIVGGRDALQFEYPHSVALGYGSDMNKLKFLCGATLISERFLLTAAHCATNRNVGKPTYAVIGDNILDPKKMRGNGGGGEKPSSYRKVVRIANHIVHPLYKPPLIYNDIALLQLSSPLELDRYVLPACVGNPLTSPKRNSPVEASGWGITDAASSSTSNTLQAINITMIEGDICNQIYGLEADKGFRYPQGIVKTQLCATGEDKDTCRGDSGGGLYTREGSCVFHVVGITSIGSKVCGLGNPAVYTTVAAFQDWIESTVWGGSSSNSNK